MRLWHTKTVWEKLAREDPFWAVLTDPDKSGNRWQVEEFFATGEKTVALDIAAITREVTDLAKGCALDFGCGVGRLTQALAGYFFHVTGVDVAAPMIEQAQKHNRCGERVSYHHNPASDLKLFADDSFDFVYSIITLQHIPPPLIRGYLKEFCRVCRPGGVIFFQLPTHGPERSWRYSWYPPTAWMRIKRLFLKKTALMPEMTMNGLKKDEVLSILHRFGAERIQATPYNATGDLKSFSYLAIMGSGRDM